MLRPPHKSKVFLLRSLTRRLTNDTIGRSCSHDRCRRRELSFVPETSDWFKSRDERKREKEKDRETYSLASARDETQMPESWMMLAAFRSKCRTHRITLPGENSLLNRHRILCVGILDSNRFISKKVLCYWSHFFLDWSENLRWNQIPYRQYPWTLLILINIVSLMTLGINLSWSEICHKSRSLFTFVIKPTHFSSNAICTIHWRIWRRRSINWRTWILKCKN